MSATTPATKANATKLAGDDAERVAEKFLLSQGLKLLARNFRCRFGEIDLVMQERDTLVFVEVRLRRASKSQDFGGAAGSITAGKQKRIIAAAHHYLANLRTLPPCRIDAVLMNRVDASGIEWLKGAFEA